MLQRFVPRVSRAMMRAPSAGFCMFKSYLDPHKHNTMNHNIHNVYIELYDTGIYPELVVNQSEPSRAYEEQLRSLAVDILKSDYPQIDAKYLQNNGHRTWNDALRRSSGTKTQEPVKDFNLILQSLLNRLSFNVIVKESKWTWVKEQEERLKFTTKFFQRVDIESVEEFFKAYSLCIESLVSISNFGRAKDIPHDLSSLQKAIQREEENENPVGVKEIDDSPNFVNRILALIHKI